MSRIAVFYKSTICITVRRDELVKVDTVYDASP